MCALAISDISRIEFSKSDTRKNITLPKTMTPDLAEEVGLHVGDGSMNFYTTKGNKGLFQLRGHIKDDQPHYKDRVKSLYKKLYGLDINIREMKSTGVVGFQIWSDAMVNFKNKILGLPLGKKIDIAIPKLINNRQLFCSFMRGLFDTDGCLYIENKRGKPYPRIEISTTSKMLALQIIHMLRKCGINPTYHEQNRRELNWSNLHSIISNGYPSLDRWFKIIGSNNPKHIRKYQFLSERKKWLGRDFRRIRMFNSNFCSNTGPLDI